MWRLCALCAVMAAGAPCDDGRFNIHVDLLDESAYICKGDYIPPSSKVIPTIATKYKQENTYHACMDVRINYEALIPNSGAHRPLWAKYGEYIYCPPQRYVHNLQHAGVAFLYHPCVDSQLKEAFSYVARSYVPRHVITTLPSLSRERPLALAAWCSTLEMSHINLTEMSYWLKENLSPEGQNGTEGDGAYQHLLIRPAKMNTNPGRALRVLHSLSSPRTRSVWRFLKRQRRAVLGVTPLVQDAVFRNVSVSISSSTPTGHPKDTIAKNTDITTLPAETSTQPSTAKTSIPSFPAILKSDLDSQAVKTSIHSRETEGNKKVPGGEPPVHTIVPTQGNISKVAIEPNVSQSIGSSIAPENGEKGQQSPQLEAQEDHHADLPQEKTSVTTVPSPKVTQQLQHPQSEQKLLPTTTAQTRETGLKQECHCKHDDDAESPANAQRRLGAGQQKSSDSFVSTPRTEEATWAAASLIFLFVLMTISVFYTQIYKKFHKGRSLYWATESHTEEKETVASVIKRRLVQGHSRRKKWLGRPKAPALLYESLSESSD